jgi:uncharacterized protein YlxP (DUF503 family)
MIGLLTIHLHLPSCRSLKEKRGQLQPLLHRLHRQFNLSTAEMELQDTWQEAVIACAMVGNNSAHLQSSLETVRKWINANWPDGEILEEEISIE